MWQEMQNKRVYSESQWRLRTSLLEMVLDGPWQGMAQRTAVQLREIKGTSPTSRTEIQVNDWSSLGNWHCQASADQQPLAKQTETGNLHYCS